MMDKFKKSKQSIDRFLIKFLNSKKLELKYHPWGSDVIARLQKSVTSGKTLRGNLVVITSKMFGNNKNAVACGAALELLHTSLLIHDDIMDRDKLRRGKPSLNAQYENWGKKKKIPEADHFGYSLAQCVGIIAQTFPLEIINNLKIKPALKQKLITEINKEFVSVTLAQMHDVYGGLTKTDLTKKDIDYILLNKTAHYTFSLPFKLGCILTNQNNYTISQMVKLGEYLGKIFQIKDDELGLFGNEKTIGKPVGSDLKEGKQTIFIIYLLKKCNQTEKKKINKILGNKKIRKTDINYIKKLILNYKIDQKVKTEITKLEHSARIIINKLKISTNAKKQLIDLMYSLTNRKK